MSLVVDTNSFVTEEECHGACSTSTGIHEGLTVGQGELDSLGYWSKPCHHCARRIEKEHPHLAPVWPFPSKEYVMSLTTIDLRHLDSSPKYHARLIWQKLFDMYREECDLTNMDNMLCDLFFWADQIEQNEEVKVHWSAHQRGGTTNQDLNFIPLKAAKIWAYSDNVAAIITYKYPTITIERLK